MKRFISMILAAAMLFAFIPQAALAETSKYKFDAVGIGHSGSASGTGIFIGAVGSSGTSTRAPFVSGTTGNSSTVVASARIGVVSFEIDGSIDPDTVSGANLSVYVNQVNGNLGSNWMLLAAYETENPTLTYAVGGMDESLYPAVDSDYSYDAAFWSNERCSSGSLGWKTIDVTRAVCDALEADGGENEKVLVVLRLQTPAAGLNISTDDNAPYLTVNTGDKVSVTVKTVDENGTELEPSQSLYALEGEYEYTEDIPETIEYDGETYIYKESASVTSLTLTAGGENVILLVYVKMNPDDFFGGETLIERGATCWFADPRSVKFSHEDIYEDGVLKYPASSKTIVGAIDTSGTVKAVQYDNLTGEIDEVTIDTGFQADDHNNPTFLELPDHRFMVFWSKHTAEEYWYYRVTAKPDDLTTLGEEKRVSVESYGTYTYPSPFYLTDAPDSFFLCWRGVNWHPTIAKYSLPDENGDITCEINPTQIVQTIGARPYVKYTANGKDRICFSFTTAHPDNNNPNWLYYAEIDINTLNLYDVENTLLCEGENLPYGKDSKINTSSDYGSFTVDSPSNKRDWVWDIEKDQDGNPVILFTEISSGKTQHDYYYGKWNPETKTWNKTYIADGGGRFHQGTGEMCYSGGLCLDHSDPSVVYLSKPTEGFYGSVYEIWKLKMNGTEIESETQITKNSKYNNVRPYVARGSSSSDKISLTWMNGLYYYWIVSDDLPDAFPTSIMTLNDAYAADIDLLLNSVEIPETVLDSLDLPSEKDGITITWKSSNTDVITDSPTANGEYTIPQGYVTRGDSDVNVTLTATAELDGETSEKTYNVTVKAAKPEEEKVAYLYAYFRGAVNGSEEHLQIHLATSLDGLNWTDLNGNWPVITSTMGTTGLRDPYIIRSRYGDKFYLIATDLNTLDGQGWTKWSMEGSKYLAVWESEDLVNWSEERLVKFADENMGCAWAPESIYDETTGEYLVYASAKDLDAETVKDTVYVSRTRDFKSFTAPEVFLGGNGTPYIDSTIIKGSDGKFYRFSKENSNYIMMDVADTAHGPYIRYDDFYLGSNKYNTMKNVEGPAVFRFNGTTDRYCLLIDDYGTGAGFTPYETEDIASGKFTKSICSMPTGAKHGVVLPISQSEYDAILEKWGSIIPDDYESEPILSLDFESETDGFFGNAKITTDDEMGNVLTLDGSDGTYFEFPENIFDRRDTFTLSMDVKSNMTSGNYFTFGVGQSDSLYYFFKDSDKSLKSAITISGYKYEEKAEFESAVSTVGQWAHITLVVEPTEIKIYKNGVLVAQEDVKRTISHLGTENLKAYLGKSFFSADEYFSGSFGNVKLYNRALSDAEILSGYEISDEDAVLNDPNYVSFGQSVDSVKSDIDLPETGVYGSSITWEISDESVISPDGSVTRSEDDEYVILTGTFTKGEYVNTVKYLLTVKRASEEIKSTADWSCHEFEKQSDKVYFSFEITPYALTDGVIGICASSVTLSSWSGYSIAVRVKPNGYFDAHNGSEYVESTVAYSPGSTYRCVIEADIPSQSYSFWVIDESGEIGTVAENYSFRSKSGSDLSKVNIRGGNNISAGLFAVDDFKVGKLPVYVLEAKAIDSSAEFNLVNFGETEEADVYVKFLGGGEEILKVTRVETELVRAEAKSFTFDVPDTCKSVSFFTWRKDMNPLARRVRRKLLTLES